MSFVCGIDLGGTTTKVVWMAEDLGVHDRQLLPTDDGNGPTGLVGRLSTLLDEFESAHGEVSAIGVSMAGLVDSRGWVVEAPNLPTFVGFDMVSALRARRPKIALHFENDVNCAIVGEHRRGAGRGHKDLCMLSLGTGVGGGILIDGRLFHGHGGLAGELGHLVIDLDGPLCTCGKRGHVEAHLSTSAIIEHARRHLADEDPGGESMLAKALAGGEELTVRLVSEQAAAGDASSCRILAVCGRYLGAACASVAHAFHPSRILIGGGVSGAGAWLLEPARAAFEEFAMQSTVATVELALAELGGESAAIGAACLGLDARSGRGGRDFS